MITGASAADSLQPYVGYVSDEELKKHSEFLDVLKKLDTYLESQRKTEWEKSKEREERLAKAEKDKRIREMQLRIRTLESRLLQGGGDMTLSYTQKELSTLKGQLFMLMLFG